MTPDPHRSGIFATPASATSVLYGLYLVMVPLTAHWLFSALGFNPTDDGFTLAASRRLLDGQIPHRDFITIRPAGSAMLHLPFVAWGGNHVFLASRLFVWLQFAWIALAWTRIIGSLCKAPRDPIAEVLIAIVAFTLCSHYFPIMAWPTIDGLFLSSSGLLLCLRQPLPSRVLGYFLIGAACLCKQNYVFFAVFAVLALSDGRKLFVWIALALPPLLYLAIMVGCGALADVLLQLSTQTDINTLGFKKFLWEYATAWGMTIGYIAARLLFRREVLDEAQNRTARWYFSGADFAIGTAGIGAVVLFAGSAMTQGRYLGAPSFGIFGMALGATLFSVVEGSAFREMARAGAVTVAAAWCVALSVGYNTPALGSGLCVVYLLWLVRIAPVKLVGIARLQRAPLIPLLLAGVLWIDFRAARVRYVYLDRPADQLTFPVGDVLAGGAGLLTGENTYAFLADLNEAIGKSPDRRYAILPDLAAYWVKSAHANPLSIDWPQWVDLGRPELVLRVTGQLDSQRGSLTIIVQKVEAFTLAQGFIPLRVGNRYAVVSHIRQNFTKIGETRFYDLYR